MRIEMKPIKNDEDISILLPLLRTIWYEVFPPIIGMEQTEYMLEHYQSFNDIQHEIENNAKYYFINMDNLNIGYLAYEIKDEYLFISKIYLINNERGKGISSFVFKWFEEQAILAGRNKMHLHVNRNNTQAINVYKHKGFSIIKEAVTKIGNNFVMDDYFMEKQI
jgi:GNAT superfamily N-acetyltransferase